MEMMYWGGDSMIIDVLAWCWGELCRKTKEEIPIPEYVMLRSNLGCCRCRLIAKANPRPRCKTTLRNSHDGAAATRRAWKEICVSIYSVIQRSRQCRGGIKARCWGAKRKLLTTLGLRLRHLNRRSGDIGWRHFWLV